MDFIIRELQPDDYPAVVQLWNRELCNPRVNLENFAEIQRKMRTDPAYVTFVALDGDIVIGFATAVQVMAAGFPVGYLKMNGIAVTEAYQGKGAGRALMARVEALAREKGLSSIGLASGFRRTGAHAFYEALGYEKGSYWFSKSL